MKPAVLCGAALLLLGSSANATTYEFSGGPFTWTSSCTPGPALSCPPVLPPGGISATVIIDFDTSEYNGTLTSDFSYSISGPIDSGPVNNDYLGGSVTLTDGQITDADLPTPGNRLGMGQFEEGIINSGGYAFVAFFSSAGLGGSFSATGLDSGTWSGPIADQFTTPLPTTLPLFATGLSALGLFGWLRNPKARTCLLGVA